MSNKEKYIQNFKDLYRKKEGKILTDQEAFDHFEKLIVLVDVVYKPISKKLFENSLCPICGESVDFEDFRDSLSEGEFLISGLCQDCQDKTFK